MISNDVNKRKIGEFVINDFADNLKRAFEVGEANQFNVFDIRFRDPANNPMTFLDEIYSHIGENFSDAQKRPVGDYPASSSKEK